LDNGNLVESKLNNTETMKSDKIIRELSLSYAMELETVQNYIAASVNLDGVRSEVIKKALAADVAVEVQHAQQLAARIKTIGGIVPGSLDLPRGQKSLQPKKDTTDVVAVIKGVIAAEEAAIAQYNKIIKLCEGVDYVTQDMVIEILGGEEDHRREFTGFLQEYEKR
jgi:bacterioferritin